MQEHRDPASYWRRRFLILVGCLGLVAAVTGGLSALAGPVTPIGTGSDRGSLAAGDTLPAAAYGAPAGATPSVTPSPATSPSPTVAPSRTASPSRTPAASRTPSKTMPPASHSAAGKSCAPASIVLSLFTGQGQYRAGQDPVFEVYAVSTAPGTCDLAYGASVVRIVVTRQGRVMWDSAACKAGAPAAARTLPFAQGVPQVVAVSWNRQASTPACAGSVPAGTTGTLDAVAIADGRSSAVHSFALTR